MSKLLTLGDHQAILTRMEVATGATVNLPAPFAGANSLSVFETAVADGRRLLPLRYQRPYVDVLEQAVVQARVVLNTLSPRAQVKRKAVLTQLEMIFNALAAPIVQLRSASYQKELKAFLALISDIYKHFVDNRKIRSAAKSTLLYPSLDPLGSFNRDKNSGPHTLPASPELPIALVGKPAGHMFFLPLWMVDGHEVGGHSILAGVEGFHTELADALESKLRLAFKDGTIKTSTDTISFAVATGAPFNGKSSVSMVDFMVKLWRQTLVEVTADTAGLLNLGPMFADGLILQLALKHPHWELSSDSIFDSRRGFYDHPADLLRARLSIEMVRRLGIAEADKHADALGQRLEDMQDEPTDKVCWVSRSGQRACEVQLSDLDAVLPVVADAILSTKLTALSGYSLLGIMPWNDSDEESVQAAALAMFKGKTETSVSLQARHIVAGSLLAVERASLSSARFDSTASLIHRTGIAMLNQMYADQCLLCNVQTLRGSAKDPSEVQLKDLVRLARKSMRQH